MNAFLRQSFLGENSERVLRSARVAIVGGCGGGSHVAQQFAHVGIGSYLVIDPQTIEESNLNRFVGATQRDVERTRPKIAIIKRVIKAVRPWAQVDARQAYWQTEGDALKRCDVVVGCLDSVRAKDELEAFCRRFLIPYVDVGMDVHGEAGAHLISGQVVLSTPGTPCLKCLGVVTEKDLEREGIRYGEAGGLPQVVWPNGVLASTAVGLVVQLLCPWHAAPLDAAYLEYDGNTGTVTPSYKLAHAAKLGCTHYPSTERGDPSFDIRQPPAAQQAKSKSFIDRLLASLK